MLSEAFWAGFGQMMAAFCIAFFIGSLFVDSSAADFESVLWGIGIAILCSAIFGYSRNDMARRRQRKENSN